MGNVEKILPQISLNDFIRNVYPGLIIASFLFFYYPSIKKTIGDDQLSISIFFLILVVISGFLFTGIYRGLFVICIRWAEKIFGRFPQFVFHEQVVNDVIKAKQLPDEIASKIRPKLEEHNLISACATRILMEKDDGVFRKELGFGNGQVHLIYSTMIFSLLGAIYFGITQSGNVLAILFLILSALLFYSGLIFNHLMDMRETLFLIQYRQDYSKLVKLYIEFIITENTKS